MGAEVNKVGITTMHLLTCLFTKTPMLHVAEFARGFILNREVGASSCKLCEGTHLLAATKCASMRFVIEQCKFNWITRVWGRKPIFSLKGTDVMFVIFIKL